MVLGVSPPGSVSLLFGWLNACSPLPLFLGAVSKGFVVSITFLRYFALTLLELAVNSYSASGLCINSDIQVVMHKHLNVPVDDGVLVQDFLWLQKLSL